MRVPQRSGGSGEPGKELVLRGHRGEVNVIRFSPDGKRAATGSDDGTVRLWDTATGQEIVTLKGDTTGVRGGPPDVESVAFSPDGRLLATAGRDRTARVWDLKTGQEVIRLQHAAPVSAVAVR